MKKRLLILLLCAALLFGACACGGGGASVDTFIIGTTTEILTANRSEYNFDVLSGTLCQLAPIYIDEQGNYAPLLCNWETSDSKTYRLTVREGFTWHDGTPVTAEDIAFTLSYLDTQTEGGYASAYEAINVIDDKNIDLVLPQVNPRALGDLSTLRIMPKHIYDGISDYTTVENALANIGCGPYKFVEFDSAAGVIKFAAVDNYPDGTPTAKNVVFKLYSSEDALYMALKAGEIDMCYKYSGGVSTSVIDELSKTEGITLSPVSSTANSAVLIFNTSMAPFDNINVRRAVVSAIDYEAFAKTFGSQYASVANTGFIPQGTVGYVATEKLTRDIEKAKAYLVDAGAADTDGDGFVEINGEKLTLPIMLRSDKSIHSRYAEFVKNNLAEIGVDVTLDVRETAVFREVTEQQHAQSAVITGLTAFGMAKNEGMAALYLSAKNSMGYAQITDPAYDALLAVASEASSIDEYKLACADIQKYYAENLPAVALMWDSHVQAFKSVYSGFVTDGTFGLLNVRSLLELKMAQ